MPKTDGKNLSEIQSAETSDGLKVFRNFFTHIRFQKDEKGNETDYEAFYELGEVTVWPHPNPILTELHSILIQELSNINELTEFEEGLEFAMLRQLEIIRLQYEYFTNPFYNDIDDEKVQLAPYGQLEDKIEELSDALVALCKKEETTRAVFYEQVFKSFRNIKLRWKDYRELASIQLMYLEKLEATQFQDRHKGWMCH